jgi:hypothetical protein
MLYLLMPTSLPSLRYFGRAKELPGVKELFQSRKNEEEEENQALSFYKKFMNQGPAYFGDLDEQDGSVLKYEHEAEDDGMTSLCAAQSQADCDYQLGKRRIETCAVHWGSLPMHPSRPLHAERHPAPMVRL